MWESLDNMMIATATNNNVADADKSSKSVLGDGVKTFERYGNCRNCCPVTWWGQNYRTIIWYIPIQDTHTHIYIYQGGSKTLIV